jgi:dTDP-4-dehydrorhamnose reductase
VKVLLIGGSGQLGTEIRRRWDGCAIVAPAHEDLPLDDGSALAAALDAQVPDLVVNCAAFHNVDRCEREPERAFAVNALAVGAAARLCARRGIVFVTFSTDYVFPGDAARPYAEEDAPRPISAYGVSKLAGELLVDLLQSRAFVVRTCGIYGVRPSTSKGHTFVDRVIAQARAGEEVRVVSDVVASPTYAGHLAAALLRLVATREYGLYHLCNVGPVSWYDFAAKALHLAGVEHAIVPIGASEWKAAARRPAFSALESRRLGALGIAMPSWDEGIAAYLRDRAAFA